MQGRGPSCTRGDIDRLMNQGVEYLRSGHLQQAETIYQEILLAHPNHPEALHLLGIIAHQLADFDKAAHLVHSAIHQRPENPVYHSTLGDIFRDQGKPEKALACYQKAITAKPDFSEVYYNKGNTFQDLGNYDEAILCYQKAIAIKSDYFEAYYNMGTAFQDQGKLEQAVSCYQKVVALRPDFVEAYHAMGIAFQNLGRFEQAISCYQKVVRCQPSRVEAFFNMAIAFQDLGRFDQAISCYKTVLKFQPDAVDAYFNMGEAYRAQGNLDESILCYREVLRLNPDKAEAYNNLGIVFKDRGDLDKAVNLYEKALQIKEGFVEAQYNMGIALQLGGRYDEGLRHYEKAMRLDPYYSPAKWLYFLSLPILYQSREDILFYRKRFSKNLDTLVQQTDLETNEQKEMALKGIGTTTNFYLQYQGENDLELQKKYGRFVCRVMAANYPKWAQPRSMPPIRPKERIRIGYVSSFMHAHTVGEFLMGWVESRDRNDFEIYCYYIGRQTDHYTERFRLLSDHFHQNHRLESIAQQIDAANLHILVFTDIGMYALATQLAGLRLAPVQCKGWGHPVTTGLPTVDYYLSSDLMEPENAQPHYSERLILLPNIALVYKKPELPQYPKTRKDLGINDNAFVYLISQSLFKCLPQYDDIYPSIAQRVPRAQFVFLSNPSPHVTRQFKARLKSAFERYCLDSNRFCLFQPRLNFSDFLSLNIVSNVLLDTLSWSGGKTTLEGLSCGMPVVTCPGDLMRGRHAFAMLKMIGVTETIANDEDDYVAIACRLGNDKEFYMTMRKLIKENQYKLYQDTSCIRALEAFYREIVMNRTLGNMTPHNAKRIMDDDIQ